MRSFAILIVSTGLLFSAAAPALSNDAATIFPSPEGTESPPSVTATEPAEEDEDDATATASPETEDSEEPEDTTDLPGSPSGTTGVTPPPTSPTDAETEDPFPSPTGEATEDPSPAPTGEATEDPSPAPTGEATEEPSPSPTGEATEEPSPTEPETPDLSVSCDNHSLHPGETVTVSCTTTPDSMPIDLGSRSSSIGGSIELNGNELTYTAPAELDSTVGDPFTVLIPDNGAATQVTFTVLGGNGLSPTPTASPSPTPTSSSAEPSPSQTSATPSDPVTSPTPTSSAADETEPTSAPDVPTPGVPSEPASNELEDHVFLPAPGMPELNELMVPWVIGDSNSGPTPEPTASSEPESSADSAAENGELAQTGTVAVYGATGIALVTMVIGTGAMALSRRIR